jgi:hypothetical protein
MNINCFDKLKVIALFLVFFLHAWIFTGKGTEDYFFLKTPAWAGVWIFYIISGYTIGKNFYNGKYISFSSFVKSRFLKIGIPTFIFVFFYAVLINPEFIKNNPYVLIRILLFVYNGAPGDCGIGALWFVSTIMQMYVLSYIFFKLIRRFKDNKSIKSIWCIFFMLSLVLRLIVNNNFNWYVYSYTLSLSNLDLFFCSFMLNTFTRESDFYNKNIEKMLWVALFVFIAINTWFYTHEQSVFLGSSCLNWYKSIFPSVYLVIINSIIYFSDTTIKLNVSGWGGGVLKQ